MSRHVRSRYWRRAFLTITTLAGRARAFIIPYRYADQVKPPARYPALLPLFEAAAPRFRANLEVAARHLPRLLEFANGTPPEPRFDQDWFPRLDAVMAYTLVRTLRPRRVVEVGSGHSTRFLVRAVKDEGIDIRVTAIDPAPRATLTGLPVEFIRTTVEKAGAAPFASLRAGDMLLVDSSHILMPGSDVDFILNSVLPTLPAGVHIHFHDVFLPDGYPTDWAWRGYNEQNAVAALIAAGGYRLIWSSHYVFRYMQDDLTAAGFGRLRLPEGARESSLWLIKT